MKLDTQKYTEVLTSDSFSETNFGIRNIDVGLILEVLRSRMYSNPIRIICQEICSNARDANREAGTPKRPIRVKIEESIFRPGQKDYIIEDDGPGISPDRMAEIFVNYGASTKRDTNVQTGGFGLGCKTPFSYADSFSIITKHRGTRYVYQAIIEGNKTGKMILLHQSDTSEGDGTSIVIPVNNHDILKFCRETFRTTSLWDVPPEYHMDYAGEKLSFHIKDRGLFLIQPGLFEGGYYALVDGIPYRLNESILDLKYSSYALFFRFSTGSISVSANRENLYYDEQTIKTLKSRILTRFQKEADLIQSRITKSKNAFEAKVIMGTETGTPLGKTVHLYHNFFWNNNLITKNINYKGVKFIRVKKDAKKAEINYIPSDWFSTPIYLMDMSKISEGRKKTIFKTHDSFYLIYCQPNADMREINSLELKKFSEVPFERKKGDRNLFYNIAHVKYHTISTYDFVKSHSVRTDNVSSLTGFYAIRERLSLISYSDRLWFMLIKSISNLPVRIIRSKYEPVVKTHWIPYKEALKKHSKYFQSVSDKIYLKEYDDDINELLKIKWPDNIQKILEYGKNCIHVGSSRIPAEFCTIFPPSEEIKKLKKIIEEIYHRYPLLKYLEYSNGDRINFESYITLINKEIPWISDGSKQPIISQ